MKPPPGCPLTEHQYKLIWEMAETAETQQQIAERLGMSASAVRSAFHCVARRLGVHGSAQVVIGCVKRGWIPMRVLCPDLINPDLAHLEVLFAALVAVASTTDDEPAEEEHELTEAQLHYLAAVDQYIRAEPEGRQAARNLMTERLPAAIGGAISITRRDRMRDLVDVIVDGFERCT